MLRISSALHTIEEKWRSKRDAAGVHGRTAKIQHEARAHHRQNRARFDSPVQGRPWVMSRHRVTSASYPLFPSKGTFVSEAARPLSAISGHPLSRALARYYIFFSEHVASHMPPAALQSASVLAVDTRRQKLDR